MVWRAYRRQPIHVSHIDVSFAHPSLFLKINKHVSLVEDFLKNASPQTQPLSVQSVGLKCQESGGLLRMQVTLLHVVFGTAGKETKV